MEVTAITRRRDAVLTSFISQVTPNESSVLRCPAQEAVYLRHLRDQLGIKGVQKVSAHEPLTGVRAVMFVVFDRGVPTTEIWRALYAVASLQAASGKMVIAINDDIDPKSPDAILWAMAYRARPHLDMHILPHQGMGHGPRDLNRGGDDSALLVDATLKGDLPPISLPKREFMEEAKIIWEEQLGLPSCSRRRHGSAILSAAGARNSTARPIWRQPAITGRSASCWPSEGAAMSR